jgi:hypothetical protein
MSATSSNPSTAGNTQLGPTVTLSVSSRFRAIVAATAS